MDARGRRGSEVRSVILGADLAEDARRFLAVWARKRGLDVAFINALDREQLHVHPPALLVVSACFIQDAVDRAGYLWDRGLDFPIFAVESGDPIGRDGRYGRLLCESKRARQRCGHGGRRLGKLLNGIRETCASTRKETP